jgi:hypothetical protein
MATPPDSYRIRFDGKEWDEDFRRIYRMRMSDELGDGTEFWSDKLQHWRPIREIMEEEYPLEAKVAQFREHGFKRVEVLGSNSGDCPECLAICGVHPIDQLPDIPPARCVCRPWCRLVVIVTNESK